MASGRKTEQVKQLLVRYVRDERLQSGDRLPALDFLRRLFNVGTATISAAVDELKLDGVLEVRDKVGVFVRDPNADGHAGRIIGITASCLEESPYHCCMLCALQMKLIGEGCHSRIYRRDISHCENSFDFKIDEFPGLKRSIENGELDGIIHLDDFKEESIRFISRHHIPLVFVGSEGISPNGVFFDQKMMLTEICRKLPEFRALRPALYSSGGIDKYLNPLFMELTDNRGQVYSGFTLEDGEKIALKILALPAEQRPDWIIYMDDTMALKITSVLALRLPAAELPRAVISGNKQLKISYPVPDPVLYDIDLFEAAGMGVNMLMNAMKTGNLEQGRIYYHYPSREKKNI